MIDGPLVRVFVFSLVFQSCFGQELGPCPFPARQLNASCQVAGDLVVSGQDVLILGPGVVVSVAGQLTLTSVALELRASLADDHAYVPGSFRVNGTATLRNSSVTAWVVDGKGSLSPQPSVVIMTCLAVVGNFSSVAVSSLPGQDACRAYYPALHWYRGTLRIVLGTRIYSWWDCPRYFTRNVALLVTAILAVLGAATVFLVLRCRRRSRAAQIQMSYDDQEYTDRDLY